MCYGHFTVGSGLRDIEPDHLSLQSQKGLSRVCHWSDWRGWEDLLVIVHHGIDIQIGCLLIVSGFLANIQNNIQRLKIISSLGT